MIHHNGKRLSSLRYIYTLSWRTKVDIFLIIMIVLILFVEIWTRYEQSVNDTIIQSTDTQ